MRLFSDFIKLKQDVTDNHVPLEEIVDLQVTPYRLRNLEISGISMRLQITLGVPDSNLSFN